MKKLLISILFLASLLIFQGKYAFAGGDVMTGPFTATVLHVYDGDTILARVPVWLGQDITTRIRIKGIDTPEMHAKCKAELKKAKAAKKRLTGLILDKTIVLTNVEYGKYAGRVLADVKTSAGDLITDILMREELARPYEGGKRASWC